MVRSSNAGGAMARRSRRSISVLKAILAAKHAAQAINHSIVFKEN